MEKENVLDFLLAFSIVLIGFFVGGFIGGLVSQQTDFFDLFYPKVQTSEEYNNFSLKDEADKLYKNISAIFYYNLSNSGKELTYEQLVQEGGVCSHWADLYISEAEKDGWLAKPITFYYNDTNGHKLAMLYSSEGYCILDQNVYPFCVELK